MIYDSTQSDDYLWYLILRGKQKKEKPKHSIEQSVSPLSMLGKTFVHIVRLFEINMRTN